MFKHVYNVNKYAFPPKIFTSTPPPLNISGSVSVVECNYSVKQDIKDFDASRSI